MKTSSFYRTAFLWRKGEKENEKVCEGSIGSCHGCISIRSVIYICNGKKSNKEVITVGISPDYKPYESLNKKNKMVGFDIDMVKWFGKYLSKEEGKKVTFQFKQMDFDNIVTQLQGDQVDLGISGFTYSEDRKVEWSEPYLGSSQVAVVPNGSDITSVDQLEGKSLVAQTGATGEKAAKDVKDAQVTGLKTYKIS